ncbi:MAG: hypothetical protein JO032_01385 [Alphaproteobacteria bacterium]|nr:hypothetical protein [Alphaproteobacteria bacterium]
MSRLRDKTWRRFGALFAGFALYLQLALAGSGVLALTAGAPAGDLVANHALCLAEGGAQPVPPADAPPPPAHDHSITCCLWHPLPALTALPEAAPHAVRYTDLGGLPPHNEAVIAELHQAPANARAPPSLS